MVNFSPVNCSNEKQEYNREFERLLNETFKYTSEVNAHVIYNFKSPAKTLGEYEFILFIDIPYRKGNYFRTQNKIYLNTLAIAVRRFEEPEVIDVDENSLYTVDGSWEYKTEIELDRKALRSYVYDNMPDVKHFDIAMLYVIKAPNCSKRIRNDFLCFNMSVNLWQAINIAMTITKNGDGKAVDCVCFKDKTTQNNWSNFIKNFIKISDKHTKQGILTKRKIDYITKKKQTRLIGQANQAIGKKLCIIYGKAGTGKTLMLMRLMYEQVRKSQKNSHKCRLLTFNNMLVMDLNMIMKNIGEFFPTNASISSIHKFFYDIYKVSPVRYLHMNSEKINSLFTLCMTRVMKFNYLIKNSSNETKTLDINTLINNIDNEIMQKHSCIKEMERTEWEQYQE